MSDIAIVGMGCIYADAKSPVELWENVLAQRRAFRKLPDCRLAMSDYFSADQNLPDSIYSTQAAVIEGYDFDRVRFRVAGRTFRVVDWTHWLALDVATRAFDDAGFAEGEGLPRDTTGVIVGNTLTGEFSRAATLRTRWPYVRRVLSNVFSNGGLSQDEIARLLAKAESKFKEPFPPGNEESLAGGLSNTIAGRICNYFDFKGGGYTVDGACASSLLSVITGCNALEAGDLDVALVGGVDLSLDPFELVGFARAGALAHREMLVYDVDSNGFWPGEGCGLAVLMRAEDAQQRGCRIRAVIRGWGISSDGNGGITRPEIDGQMKAIERAYRRSGSSPAAITYFEGHGTGTNVGDQTELQVLSNARGVGSDNESPAFLGSIKANIGHTKAAAGIAGLIKTVLALENQIVPPTTACRRPRKLLTSERPRLQVTPSGERWPINRPLAAGVSAMGFGGINTHVVVDSPEPVRRNSLSARERKLLRSSQDCELYVFSAQDRATLVRKIAEAQSVVSHLSLAECGDFAAALASAVASDPWRAAIVGSTPEDLNASLEKLVGALGEKPPAQFVDQNAFFGQASERTRIAFLFPGQGSPVPANGGAIERRFEFLFSNKTSLPRLPNLPGPISTALAQPAIVEAEIAGLKLLHYFGIEAGISIGHSLGELTAYHWSGALSESALRTIVAIRGKAMAIADGPVGAMVSISAEQSSVTGLLHGLEAVIAAVNSPRQTVVSGAKAEIDEVIRRAQGEGFDATLLPVSHAFHSPLMVPAISDLSQVLQKEDVRQAVRPILSTVTGTFLSEQEDLRSLLLSQLVSPVRFWEAISRLTDKVDFAIEVGPGEVLSTLVNNTTAVPTFSLGVGGNSLRGLLRCLARAFVLGVPVKIHRLFRNRFNRQFKPLADRIFLANPCETVPASALPQTAYESPAALEAPVPVDHPPQASVLEYIQTLVSTRSELPLSAVHPDSKFLDDLHLSSIGVAEIVGEAARAFGVQTPQSPTDYANATLRQMADAFQSVMDRTSLSSEDCEAAPEGVDAWVRAFKTELVQCDPLPATAPVNSSVNKWRVIGMKKIAGILERAFRDVPGTGVIVYLPRKHSRRDIENLLLAARLLRSDSKNRQFVVVQHGLGGSAFARTVHQELSLRSTCVINFPPGGTVDPNLVIQEVQNGANFVEVHYDQGNRRREPVLEVVDFSETTGGKLPIGREDVVLVTGGGKGIGAECGLALARESGCRLMLVGRSNPTEDQELKKNLARFAVAGVNAEYFIADLTNPAALRRVIRAGNYERITGVLHSAGINEPRLLRDMEVNSVERILGPKLDGAKNLLKALDPKRLKIFVAFGSIIAHTGMQGDAHYGLANEWLAQFVEELGEKLPECACLTLDWSVWAGVGMGEKLAVVESLRRQDVTPVNIDAGVSMLLRILRSSAGHQRLVVAGRFGLPKGLVRIKNSATPKLRFLEKVRVHYPKVELIADAEISSATDPYVEDHIYRGTRVFPAVMSLEAIAQAAVALAGTVDKISFQNVAFARAITIPKGRPLVLRVCVLQRSSNEITACIRTDATNFKVDHVVATCRLNQPLTDQPAIVPHSMLPLMVLSPSRDLYGTVLFQGKKMQALVGYRVLTATRCVAKLAEPANPEWFAARFPQTLLLGNPAIRDAALHAIQACVPEAVVLPYSVGDISICAESRAECELDAQEVRHTPSSFTYDLRVSNPGCHSEIWREVKFQVAERRAPQAAWHVSLLGPYCQRRASELLHCDELSIVIDEQSEPSDYCVKEMVSRALNRATDVIRRPDGKPELSISANVSVAHTRPCTMVVTSQNRVACDLEVVKAREAHRWRALLGRHYGLMELLATSTSLDRNECGTRVWCAYECLRKIGNSDCSLTFVSDEGDGWVLFNAGDASIATWATITGSTGLAMAVLAAPGVQSHSPARHHDFSLPVAAGT